MKYYIDFDHTLYNTNFLISDMLQSIAHYISKNGNFNEYPKHFKETFPNIELINIENNLDSIISALRTNFRRPKDTVLKIPYNIFSLVKQFANLFNCDYFEIESIINQIINSGQKYLYDDSITFLSGLKKYPNEVYLLSHDGNDLEFQVQKIKGSGLLDENLLDAAIITKESKSSLNKELLNDITKTSIIYLNSDYKKIESIDYSNGIFIDDRPKDIEMLYMSVYKNEVPPFKARIYRMIRENGTYSKFPLNVSDYSGIVEIQNFRAENILNWDAIS